MKTLADGTKVSSKAYYYLLEFNEGDDWQFIESQFGKSKLKDLNMAEFRLLFEVATQEEFVTTDTPQSLGAIVIGSGLSREQYLLVRSKLWNENVSPPKAEFETKFLNLELDFAKLEQAKLEHVLLETVIDPFDKPKKRVRPESNKSFKNQIKNLTNNQRKNVPILRTSHKGN